MNSSLQDSKYVGFRWKEDFRSLPWYQANSAEIYLDWRAKANIMELFILGEEDSDSEAECFVGKL